MIVHLLKSKIHCARVTDANVDYEGSLSIDRNLMDRVGILPYERVLCTNATNGRAFRDVRHSCGARFGTHCIERCRCSPGHKRRSTNDHDLRRSGCGGGLRLAPARDRNGGVQGIGRSSIASHFVQPRALTIYQPSKTAGHEYCRAGLFLCARRMVS